MRITTALRILTILVISITLLVASAVLISRSGSDPVPALSATDTEASSGAPSSSAASSSSAPSTSQAPPSSSTSIDTSSSSNPSISSTSSASSSSSSGVSSSRSSSSISASASGSRSSSSSSSLSSSSSRSSSSSSLQSASSSSIQSSSTGSSSGGNAPASSSGLAGDVLALVNAERAAVGLSALGTSSALSQAAQIRAQELIDHFSHDRPDGTSYSTILEEYSLSRSAWGENIAMGQRSAEAVVDGWMNSQGHRENILRSGFTTIGIGVASDSSGRLYWVQLFIG